MKKQLQIIVVMSIILLIGFKGNAQINYEGTYSLPYQQYQFRITNLGNNNFKYALIDYHYSRFSLYNLNNTPFLLNVSVPLLDTLGGYDIGYITSTLFDCDSTNIEYVLATTTPNPLRKFYVFRTDGTMIFSRDSVTLPYCTECVAGGGDIEGITNTSDGAKMMLMRSDYKFFVYGLCDDLPVNIIEINQSTSYVIVFPNPSSNQVNFNINPPGNIDNYVLTIFDAAFQTIKNIKLNGETKVSLDCMPLSSGTYFYSLQSKNKVYQTGKFIITK